jgi:16S rRNA (cytosine1402-N4)-methyltransferase
MNKNIKTHKPVLLNETLDALNINPNGFYIDGTLGEGGHSFSILEKLSTDGLLLSLDVDIDAIQFVRSYYKKYKNWIIKKGNFANITEHLQNITRRPDGILLDLGLSSRQIDLEQRGFSYMRDEQPLDMRMDLTLGLTASDLIKSLRKDQLITLLQDFGEERHAKRIANGIFNNRENIATVGDLKKTIYDSIPKKLRFTVKHPEKQVFQALRIAVNTELLNLKQFLDKSIQIINDNGVIAIITFHSLEAKIVKKYYKEWEKNELGKQLKVVKPTDKEIKLNSRAHSAQLRCFKKY